MLLLSALLALAPAALADTGEEHCVDWGVTPSSLYTSSSNSHLFRIDTLRECRSGLECIWSLTNAVGELGSSDGLNVWWYAPGDPPDECEPLDTSLVATCVLWESYTRTATVDIQVRCTDEEREQLAQERAELLSVQGGGCTSAPAAQSLLLLFPLGLFGLRRRLQG
jgi:hypothetical protein